jgi:hypothetical protein
VSRSRRGRREILSTSRRPTAGRRRRDECCPGGLSAARR